MPSSRAEIPSPAQALPYIRLSVVAAIATITLKFLAWWFSGSVGLLSDALESFVNLVGALFALSMLSLAATPPDEEHPWGHNKAEYFSSGFEGTLIFMAAGAILWAAVPRLFSPEPLESLGIGLWFSVASTLLNFIVSRILAKAAQRLHSVVLEADAAHLMTDVWTSIGVLAGLLAYMLTGWLWLDALLAILVALHILTEGWRLMYGAFNGLMDQALADEDIALIEQILGSYAPGGVSWTQLRTRRAGTRRFAHVNILVPGDWSVANAHDLLDEIESRIAGEVHGTQATTHLEPRTTAARHLAED
ncbi:MAG: cation-efflux pump [Candidatus Dactylopiibacterium carminicum]|uniref:Cation transporter n=1 Tax=Candidatus Dactylopiibacterium carminicum TaxID=857335 RepID=A0A272EVH5_9RHOO|nr:cation diffusion facilitator family transporter [Candidatus Dactylopiibacterium carminicum]KAF7598172.1 cation transporter [Candidatus Dactylopiibacterium carminicum]PAS94105.1 MAG: cation-efflux pump [Candidatus Dactylopiibacterium carminicum]PAS96859.1 MAG: cation-efflux pump [Candidatus Dactylopiibacterium carminicum]PAS98131.1 MAG: cation-efflux pump [Candidatus Dactylopiibacterium carminicum]